MLFDSLSDEDKIDYENNHSLGVYDIIRKIETGKWK